MLVRHSLLSAALLCCLVSLPAFAAEPVPSPTPAPEFVYCPPSTFANCTVAKCKPKNDGSGNYSCDCFLDSRYSATAYEAACVAATATTAQSRFHPIESYQKCANPSTDTAVWAWCLGVPCKTRGNSTTTTCDCTPIPPNVPPFPYVVVTPTYLPNGCKASASGEVWSSATVDDSAQITAFLRQQPGLENLPAPRVISGPK